MQILLFTLMTYGVGITLAIREENTALGQDDITNTTSTNESISKNNIDSVKSFEFINKWGSLGEGDGQFNGQNDVDFYDGSVYVADYANHRIQIFDPNGTFITKFGEGGVGDGQFHKASALSIDSKGDIYVADQFNFRIQKFTNDGKFITKWGSKGTGDGQFQGPSGLSIDANDNIYATDKNNDRVQVFASDGQFITKFGEAGAGDGQFDKPEGVGLDKETGTVYVADTGNTRIQVFKLQH